MMNQFYQKSLSGLRAGKKRLTFALVMLTSFLSFSLVAQDITVSGTVKDATGGTLPGVTVQVKGTSKGTQTSIDGSYQLAGVPSNGTLIFSFIGMTTQEVAVGGRASINVTLSDDAQALEEVVVVGYGTQKRKEISGTVSSVSNKEFNVGQVTTPLQAIQGKVAGLAISSGGSDPNSSPSVRLRGVGSLSANASPLYVVDGVFVNDISTISPQDIETIDVLRDASSAAIYGSRGADGVIIVTTKRGKEGKTSASYSGYVGTEVISARPEYLSADEYRAALKSLNVGFDDKGANTDWVKELTRSSAMTHNHDFSFSGGAKGFGYRASIGYLNQEGIVKTSSRERISARLNIDQKALNDKLAIQYNLFFGKTDRSFLDNEGRTVGFGPYKAFSLAANMQPTDPVYNADGTYFERAGDFSKYNPVALLLETTDNKSKNEYLGSVKLRYNLTKELVFGVNGAMDGYNDAANFFVSRLPREYNYLKGYAASSLDNRNNKLLETTLNYDKKVGSGTLALLAGYGYQDLTNSGFAVRNNNFISDDLMYNNLGAGVGVALGLRANDAVQSYKTNERLVSFFGRAQYSLMDKYFVTANFRRDGSTKFGANNKWGNFPAFSVGWTISEEAFLKGNSTINNLKLRANWGQTGQSNDIAPYTTLALVGPGDKYYDNGNWLPTYGTRQNENPDLKWQVNTSYGAGLDFAVADYRLTGSLDYYVRNTSDLLYSVPAPSVWTDSKGVDHFAVVSSILANIGSMKNSGVELTLNGLLVDKKDFSWNMIAAIASNKNEVTSLESAVFKAPDNIKIGTGLGDFIRGTSDVQFSVLQVGYPVGQFWGAKVLSIDDKGKFVVEDINGDGVQDPIGADRTYIGNPQPKVIASLTNTLKYKNVTLSFLLNGRFGNDIFNANRMLLGRQSRLTSSAENALVEASTTEVNDDRTGSYDYYIEKGNFVRLQNANLSYRIPKSVGPLSNVSVYVSGNNLFLLTKYKGVDPELKLDGLAPGIDTRNFYFKTRGFQFGVNASF